ncbi:NUDIX hydrolase [Deinococcus humi]|uniref:8-oxo-dGTP pyrophosphatase MutT (NUDIX family) n=1 Tax=Deinococcus humi TaxID=662880 RepID=A0A7W8JV06_9DEIO|nr:NUDIX domain-containing protein [Deinococcus humi]MBB5362139.1 8-oxo-dGTP pyrophosphatase MutT (NUDIX family) [Deinococcus humi]GGO21885.1 DNA mismatch repair protein MutT [Deinococcus humi]
MTDIRLHLGGLKFSVRVVIVCIRNGKLLANTEQGIGFWYLPGGALATDEDVRRCAEREWLEETGVLPGQMRLLGIVENFFGPAHRRQHEIGFYFHMDPPAELPDEPFSVLDDANVLSEWIPVDEIESRPVYPLALRELLGGDSGAVRHIVNREDLA